MWGCQIVAGLLDIGVLRPWLGPKIKGPPNEMQLLLAFLGGTVILGPGPLERYPRGRTFQISDPQAHPESKDVCLLNMINLYIGPSATLWQG